MKDHQLIYLPKTVTRKLLLLYTKIRGCDIRSAIANKPNAEVAEDLTHDTFLEMVSRLISLIIGEN
jgi:hypothetical protein